MDKKQILVLEDCRNLFSGAIDSFKDRAFKIQSITNSVDFKIGEFLTVDQVRDLCNITWIEVKIIARKK